MTVGAAPVQPWTDVGLAVSLLAVNPAALGGLVLRAGAGPERAAVLALVERLLPATDPVVRLPLGVTEDRLLGGLSLAATLQTGRVVIERGVLPRAHGGVLIVAMAERVEPLVASHLCHALDRGELSVERDGLSALVDSRFGVIALDEGHDDEQTPAKLRDRLALRLDLTGLRLDGWAGPEADHAAVARARELLPRVALAGDVTAALCQAARLLGIESLRAPLLAAQVARVHAAWEGRRQTEERDAVVAARLVLGPLAVCVPAPPEEPAEAGASTPPDPLEPSDPGPALDRGDDSDEAPDTERDPARDHSLDEIVLEAARSGLPAGLLDGLNLGAGPRLAPASAGRAGARRASLHGGRPSGTRPGVLRSGERLHLLDTLRAAAPWQRLRRRERATGGAPGERRLELRPGDFRLIRFVERAESCVIFSVDASGSAALQRLAEAKGAVEQVLLDCYTRRDHVALIAFRGAAATLLLPPTRSLARARRCLSELAGGGATPLALGIDAALALAVEARQRGRTPIVVVMTDARANVGKGASVGAAAAGADALASAHAVRGAGVRALLLDTSPRPREQARVLADAMGARYVPLPPLDPAAITRHVHALLETT